MGTCPSSAASSRLLATSPVPIHGAAVNKQINQRLREDCKKNRRDVKVLLLGAADCGKSTILKQVRLLHADPFDWVELEMTKPLVYDTIFTNIRCMISAMGQMSIGAIQAEVAASRLLTMIDNRGLGDDLDAQSVSDLKVLWRDSDFIAAFEGRSELQVDDSLRYFMNDLDRIAQPGYVPSTQDVLYVRRRTTGVSKVTIKMKSSTCLHIFDVGGQRSERRKWLHLFDDVTALIFIIAINEYNQMLLEDKSVNRLEEALNLYRQIVGCVWFNKTFVVTFLNKIDLFKEKLQKVPLNVLFKSYTGGTNYDVAINFLDDIVSKIFLSTNAELTRRIYIHYTCATDTYQVEKIIKSVIDIVMTINTANSGMV